ncbi:hypothetical protein ACEZCY_08080 [Streptacidiphilus sp. N1-12]|uniref:Uncharacterized protein n=2 Tax=Streptacidiphilus alkalitolerans TaxID=3342712 RepID=A0ABV6VFB5_9ACTN
MGALGHLVLYAAFAVVALWLLGELLLQHRAEPHWRALALLGFLVLVGGVAEGSLPLIGAGVVAFGIGQFLVTRSVRTGSGTHWSLRAADGSLPGPLGRLPLLGSVFPPGEAPAFAVPPPGERVGEVGPVEPLEPVQPAYGYDPALDYTPPEYVQPEYEQQPAYTAEYDYTQQQYSGYDPYPAQPQPAYAAEYDYGQQSEQQPYYGYEQQPAAYQGYQPEYQQEQSYEYQYPYQPEPAAPEPAPDPWQPHPQQYG